MSAPVRRLPRGLPDPIGQDRFGAPLPGADGFNRHERHGIWAERFRAQGWPDAMADQLGRGLEHIPLPAAGRELAVTEPLRVRLRRWARRMFPWNARAEHGRPLVGFRSNGGLSANEGTAPEQDC